MTRGFFTNDGLPVVRACAFKQLCDRVLPKLIVVHRLDPNATHARQLVHISCLVAMGLPLKKSSTDPIPVPSAIRMHAAGFSRCLALSRAILKSYIEAGSFEVLTESPGLRQQVVHFHCAPCGASESRRVLQDQRRFRP